AAEPWPSWLASGARRPPSPTDSPRAWARSWKSSGLAVSNRYHRRMAMTLRLTDEEQTALRDRAALEGISMQDAARRAVRDYVARGEHRDRVAVAADRVKGAHAEALDRLGQ